MCNTSGHLTYKDWHGVLMLVGPPCKCPSGPCVTVLSTILTAIKQPHSVTLLYLEWHWVFVNNSVKNKTRTIMIIDYFVLILRNVVTWRVVLNIKFFFCFCFFVLHMLLSQNWTNQHTLTYRTDAYVRRSWILTHCYVLIY